MGNVKIIRVFIGSPGGLDEERRAAHEVVDEVNRNHSEHWGCQFRLLGYEDTIPGYQRAQSKINEDLDKCHYFLGVLWNRWGSKPSTDENGYTSGFHEEYCRAVQRIESKQMLDLAIYFKKGEIPSGLEPDEQYQMVLDFRKECIDGKNVFFKDFETLTEFRNCIRNKLIEIGWQETDIGQTISQENTVAKVTGVSSQQTDDSTNSDNRLISLEASEFISQISERPADSELTEPFEIARFRLISSVIKRPGNDILYIGNHDANLIFQHLRKYRLSEQENRGLIRSGIHGFSHQNVPLWAWLSKAEKNGDIFSEVKFLSVLGDKQEKKNAIRVLQLAEQAIPQIDNIFDTRQVLDLWLSNENEDVAFEAAVSFLSTNAQSDDISLIQEFSPSLLEQRQVKVDSAIVGILARKSVEEALCYLVEKNVDKVGDDLLIHLFKGPQLISAGTLTLCLSAKFDGVRIQSARLLFDRDEITEELAKILLTDSSHDIRLVAAESFQKLGHPLDEDVLKKALMINNRFSFLASSDKDATYYDNFLSNRLSELDLSNLQERVVEAGVFVERELSVLYSRFGAKVQDEIRSNLEDRFESFFNEVLNRDKAAGKLLPDTESKIRDLEPFLRTKLCNHALTALCELEIAKDLFLVRKTLDEMEIDANDSILKYLARFGDWSDIERIRELGKNVIGHRTLFATNKSHLPLEKAKAILALGKQSISEMLALELDSEVRKSLAKQIPKGIFVELTDEILLRELSHDDDDYRIIISLRCVLSLPKNRVTSLLERYVNSDRHRYYNGIHWLDLGASLTQRVAKRIAERALKFY